jgi:dienelactone hydrolase
VVCVNGGQRGVVPGTWSATLEWLVDRLAPAFPDVAFMEVRYRYRSWNRLESCVEDARAALDAAVARGAQRCALLGFSMGGAVALSVAGHPSVTAMIGLAPWLPRQLPVETLVGRRLAIRHGALDRYLPGVPGVHPRSSAAGAARAGALGVETEYSLIPGSLHAVALRPPWGGRPIALPRADEWLRFVSDEVARFRAAG